jgi:hypothetical protein
LAFEVWSEETSAPRANTGRHAWAVLFDVPADRIRGRRTDGLKTMEYSKGRLSPALALTSPPSSPEPRPTLALRRRDAPERRGAHHSHGTALFAAAAPGCVLRNAAHHFRCAAAIRLRPAALIARFRVSSAPSVDTVPTAARPPSRRRISATFFSISRRCCSNPTSAAANNFGSLNYPPLNTFSSSHASIIGPRSVHGSRGTASNSIALIVSSKCCLDGYRLSAISGMVILLSYDSCRYTNSCTAGRYVYKDNCICSD